MHRVSPTFTKRNLGHSKLEVVDVLRAVILIVNQWHFKSATNQDFVGLQGMRLIIKHENGVLNRKKKDCLDEQEVNG